MKGKAPNGGECVNGEGKQGRGVRGRGQERLVRSFLHSLFLDEFSANSLSWPVQELLKCVMHCITLWRITFRFEGEDAFDVDLEDYH